MRLVKEKKETRISYLCSIRTTSYDQFTKNAMNIIQKKSIKAQQRKLVRSPIQKKKIENRIE